MENTGIRAEERKGLIIALGLHLAVLAALVTQALLNKPVEVPKQPERMTVNLATDVGLEATAPDPVPESRAAEAPMLSDAPAPAPDILDAPSTPPVQPPVSRPAEPQSVASPRPRPVPTSRPSPQPSARPTPKTTSRPAPRSTPKARSSPTAPTRPASRPSPKATSKPGGSRIGDDFLAGSGSSSTSAETRTPASQIGASTKASLVASIAREIKPHWQPPSGPEVEKITTVLRFRLNPNGSLAGRPSVVRQTGVNDTNRAQADRHAEQAIRAVQLAAPFDLPEEYYEAWKVVGPFSFDWRLAQ